MISLALLAGLAVPRFRIDPGLAPADAVEREAEAAWSDLECLYQQATGAAIPPRAPAQPISIRREEELQPGQGGMGLPGWLAIRQPVAGRFEDLGPIALRHELAHQFLWQACPRAGDEPLLHEAFAMATSGEIGRWVAARRLSARAALARLERAPDAAGRDGREALAYLLAGAGAEPSVLPPVLAERLQSCAAGLAPAPLLPSDLLPSGPARLAEALVVLDLETGARIDVGGDVERRRPVGTLLLPLLVASSRSAPPLLRPDPAAREWRCGGNLPDELDALGALRRSCRGYFLAWSAGNREVLGFGDYAPLLREAGLALPVARIEALLGTGDPVLLSPLGIAAAYRELARRRPEVLAAFRKRPAGAGRERVQVAVTGARARERGAPPVVWVVAVGKERVAVACTSGLRLAAVEREVLASLEE